MVLVLLLLGDDDDDDDDDEYNRVVGVVDHREGTEKGANADAFPHRRSKRIAEISDFIFQEWGVRECWVLAREDSVCLPSLVVVNIYYMSLTFIVVVFSFSRVYTKKRKAKSESKKKKRRMKSDVSL